MANEKNQRRYVNFTYNFQQGNQVIETDVERNHEGFSNWFNTPFEWRMIKDTPGSYGLAKRENLEGEMLREINAAVSKKVSLSTILENFAAISSKYKVNLTTGLHTYIATPTS